MLAHLGGVAVKMLTILHKCGFVSETNISFQL